MQGARCGGHASKLLENFYFACARKSAYRACHVSSGRQFARLVPSISCARHSKALEAVATTKLASLELENNDDRPKLVDMCTQVHMSVGVVADDFWDVMRRKVYTTPKSYLDLIGLCLEMLAQRREAVNADRDRMSIGVQKLYLEMLVRGYGLQSFRDDVKELMIKTGVKGERVAFLFTDTQVVFNLTWKSLSLCLK